MRTWIADQFEFENSSTEETVEISKADHLSRQNMTFEKFIGLTIGVHAQSEVGAAVPFDKAHWGLEARAHLAEFAQIEIPSPCDWPTTTIYLGPDEHHLVITTPDSFIRYSWSTSA